MIIEQRSGNRLERWNIDTLTYESYLNDVLELTRPFTPDETTFVITRQQDLDWQARIANAGQLMRLAYANNKAYLDKVDAGTTTNADHITQVPRLTRQMQGVIRLVVATSALTDLDFGPATTGI